MEDRARRLGRREEGRERRLESSRLGGRGRKEEDGWANAKGEKGNGVVEKGIEVESGSGMEVSKTKGEGTKKGGGIVEREWEPLCPTKPTYCREPLCPMEPQRANLLAGNHCSLWSHSELRNHCAQMSRCAPRSQFTPKDHCAPWNHCAQWSHCAPLSQFISKDHCARGATVVHRNTWEEEEGE